MLIGVLCINQAHTDGRRDPEIYVCFLSTVVRVLFSSNLGQNIGLRRNTSGIHLCKSEENQARGVIAENSRSSSSDKREVYQSTTD